MKKYILLLLAGSMAACSTGTRVDVILQNPSDINYKDAGIEIKRAAIEEVIHVPDNLLPVLRNDTGEFLRSQTEDLDGDGQWDMLFTVADFNAVEKKNVTLAFIAPSDNPEWESRTNIRFAKKDESYREVSFAVREKNAINTETQQIWQMEGPAWENDKVGFRNYFDRRNGIDIFGKVTTEMVLDNVGYKNNPSYHEFNPDWGVDVLKVGNSLGAGSIGIFYNDSLYRVGDNGHATCTVLTEGPLRSILRFHFEDWKMGDHVLTLTHDISIQAGKYFYESTITCSGLPEGSELVAGIVNMKSNTLHQVDGDDKITAFYTHDLQSEDHKNLGMGILAGSDVYKRFTESPSEGNGIIQTYGIHLKISPELPVSFRFYTVWERENNRWATAEGFEDLLRSETRSMAAPIRVKLRKQ